MFIKGDETFTPIKQLFQKFSLSPKVNSKPRKIAFNVHKFSFEASPVQRVASAYWRWETIKLSNPTLNPLKRFLSTALRIKPAKPSATNRIMNGANVSPFLILFEY
jgi:hypothetical protein